MTNKQILNLRKGDALFKVNSDCTDIEELAFEGGYVRVIVRGHARIIVGLENKGKIIGYYTMGHLRRYFYITKKEVVRARKRTLKKLLANANEMDKEFKEDLIKKLNNLAELEKEIENGHKE